jgi:hypothetical protein
MRGALTQEDREYEEGLSDEDRVQFEEEYRGFCEFDAEERAYAFEEMQRRDRGYGWEQGPTHTPEEMLRVHFMWKERGQLSDADREWEESLTGQDRVNFDRSQREYAAERDERERERRDDDSERER